LQALNEIAQEQNHLLELLAGVDPDTIVTAVHAFRLAGRVLTRSGRPRPPRKRGCVVLEPFVLSTDEEALYLALIDAPGRTPAELAPLAKTTEDGATKVLDALESTGLVTRLPGEPTRYTAIEPVVGLAPLITAQEQVLQRARAAAIQLNERFRLSRDATHPLDQFEFVADRPTLLARYYQLERLAERELRIIDVPPCVGSECRVQLERLAEGIGVRTIYDRSYLDIPDAVPSIQRFQAAGVDTRVIAGAPFKCIVADDQLAMFIFIQTHCDSANAIMVHPSAFLDGLCRMFETVWRAAIPLQPTDPDTDQPTPEERRLLALLAAGTTDEAAARRLGLSVRTVQRQVSQLLRRLDAQTRFQAGLKARARGWL
jgi:DNA-binding CsgD family transcriptional regulator/sugar-specific transcriptional regulator TrmB